MSRVWQRALLLPLSILAWLAVLVVVFWLLSHVTRALLLLVLASVIAFAVTPLINLLDRWMPRGIAIGVAYLIVFLVVLGLLGIVVVTTASQISALVASLPTYAERNAEIKPFLLRTLGPFGVTASQLNSAQTGLVSALESAGSRVAGDALSLVTGVLNTVIDAVLVLILSIYLAANGPNLQAWLRERSPQAQRRRTRLVIAIVNRVVGGYVRGQLTLAALVGLLVWIGMATLGVRYALLLGVLAFFMEFIPILGVFVSGAVCILIALFQGQSQTLPIGAGWVLALLVLGYFVLVHVIEGDLIGPRIMGRAVGVHPAVALLALVAGTELFGIWGALFGAPLAGLIQAVVVAAWREIRVAQADQLAVQVAENIPHERPVRRRARRAS